MESIYVRDVENDIIYYILCVSRLDIDYNTTITKYPTTEGANISDHAYCEPKSINLDFGISKVISTSNGFYYYDSNGNKIILGYKQVKELIKQWDSNHTLLDLQTRNDLYNNLLISKYAFSEGSEIYALDISMTLQEIRIANLKTITLPIEVETTQDSVDENSEQESGNTVSSLLGKVAAGAAIGAVVGNIVPIPGVGAGVGALVGAVGGFISWLCE
jgi:hypothetical protein